MRVCTAITLCHRIVRLNEDGKPGSASMFDFLLKEESLGEDDMREFTKDRVKKDNHNISEYLGLKQIDGYLLESRGADGTA